MAVGGNACVIAQTGGHTDHLRQFRVQEGFALEIQVCVKAVFAVVAEDLLKQQRVHVLALSGGFSLTYHTFGAAEVAHRSRLCRYSKGPAPHPYFSCEPAHPKAAENLDVIKGTERV